MLTEYMHDLTSSCMSYVTLHFSQRLREGEIHTQAITTTHTPNHPYTTPQSPHTHHHTPYTTPLPIICAKNIRNSLYILSYLRL
jgi:hypothetical protein